MGTTTKYEYLQTIRPRYQKVTKAEKKVILDEFCSVCGYSRKYAIRLLNAQQKSRITQNLSKWGQKKQYGHPLILEVLWDIWVVTNLPCSKRLKANIPLWLPHYEKHILLEEIKQKLLAISSHHRSADGAFSFQIWETRNCNHKTSCITQETNPIKSLS